MVVDFVELKNLVKERVISKFDHQNLNDFFENPSAENVAVRIWDSLKVELESGKFGEVKLYEVILWETAESFVTYRGV